ncbi:hypothetical protein P4908_04970 [Pantoea ananatis]|uniref:hypothetical protein n=1 Tax=Pantoea ananas TaxID=553 RepID=UPI0023B04EBC|nr:hypothetical protein [Pantoea ananatis]MDF7789599.1 hypothetical protein [Pantoea ananatis]
MSWLISNWRTVLALLLVVLISGLLLSSAHYRDSTLIMEQERDAALEQKKSAEAVTNNVVAAVRLFDDIATATRDRKELAGNESEQRIIVIHKAAASDRCAALPVPDVAADRLRSHRDEIRSGAPRGNTLRTDR